MLPLAILHQIPRLQSLPPTAPQGQTYQILVQAALPLLELARHWRHAPAQLERPARSEPDALLSYICSKTLELGYARFWFPDLRTLEAIRCRARRAYPQRRPMTSADYRMYSSIIEAPLGFVTATQRGINVRPTPMLSAPVSQLN